MSTSHQLDEVYHRPEMGSWQDNTDAHLQSLHPIPNLLRLHRLQHGCWPHPSRNGGHSSNKEAEDNYVVERSAMWGTPNVAIQVKCGEMPLDLKRLNLSLKCTQKITAVDRIRQRRLCGDLEEPTSPGKIEVLVESQQPTPPETDRSRTNSNNPRSSGASMCTEGQHQTPRRDQKRRNLLSDHLQYKFLCNKCEMILNWHCSPFPHNLRFDLFRINWECCLWIFRIFRSTFCLTLSSFFDSNFVGFHDSLSTSITFLVPKDLNRPVPKRPVQVGTTQVADGQLADHTFSVTELRFTFGGVRVEVNFKMDLCSWWHKFPIR